MKEPKVKRIKELKLHIEELEQRIAPGVLTVTPVGPVTTGVDGNAADGLATASTSSSGVVAEAC